MKTNLIISRLLVISLWLSLCVSLGAQDRSAAGVVTDAETGEALEYIAVYFKNTTDGCITNGRGEFFLRNTKGADSLVVEAIGYKKLIYKMKSSHETKLLFAVEPEYIRLDEAVVKPKREKYTNKGNPAVDLVKKVISNSDGNRMESLDFYSCNIYEKLTLSLEDMNPKMLEKEKYGFLSNYIDTSQVTGRSILPLSIRENIGKVYYRKHPETKKIVRTAQRIEGIDEELDVNGSLTSSLQQILTDVNIFDNDISFLANSFVSPLSKLMAISFYKYYIMDTLNVGGSPCVDLAFVPRNPESYGFTGRLYVTADSTYSVKRIRLNFPAKSNVNWVSRLQIDQEFTQTQDSLYALSREDSYVTFSISENWQGIFAHNTKIFNGFETSPDLASKADIFNADEHVIKVAGLNDARGCEYWDNARPVVLSELEQRIAEVKYELDNRTHITALTRLADAFVSEWVPVSYPKESSYFNFGPILSLAGYNYIEKLRMRVGGMTTANLSDRWFANGYLATGSGDRKLKGQIELIHSFVPKNYHSQESLRHNLSASFLYDIFSPESIGVQHDLATSLKANTVKTYQYVRKADVKYDRQWTNGLSTEFTASSIRMTPATTPDPETLRYQYLNAEGQVVTVPHITTTEFGVFLRWAPGEKQTNAISKRRNIDRETPVFTLQHKIGVPVLGGEYYFNRTDLSFSKRFRLSFAGSLDARIEASKVWNAVPWPLLSHPASNSSFSYRKETFNTMTPLEFIMDQHIKWNLSWHMKGLFFNRMPVIKRLGLRELVVFNGLWGSLTDKNNPDKNTGLFILPCNSIPIQNTPFMEVGIGIENILKCYRIAYFQRLNYGKNENQTLGIWSGFRLGLFIDF